MTTIATKWNFAPIAKNLGTTITKLGVRLDSLFVGSLSKASDQFTGDAVDAEGKPTKALLAFIDKFDRVVFDHKGEARKGWDSAGFSGSTWRQYRCRSKAALAAILAKRTGFAEQVAAGSLTKLGELGADLIPVSEARSEGTSKGKAKAAAKKAAKAGKPIIPGKAESPRSDTKSPKVNGPVADVTFKHQAEGLLSRLPLGDKAWTKAYRAEVATFLRKIAKS